MENILMVVDGLSAKLATLALVIVLLKALTKKMTKKGFKISVKLDRIMMKVHRPAGYVLVIAGAIHGAVALRVISDFGMIVWISGVVCFLGCIGAIVSFIQRKKLSNPKNWLMLHKLSTAVTVIALVVHIITIKSSMMM